MLEIAWSELLIAYPSPFGYLSDLQSMFNLLDWCDIPLEPFLKDLQIVDALPAARHLADLIPDVFVLASSLESALKAAVLSWLSQPAIGERLQNDFFAADSEHSANQLLAAYELWAACVRG